MHQDQPIQEQIGAEIAGCRGLVGLNQVELARLAFVSQSVVSESETGKRLVPWSLVDALGDELCEQGLPERSARLREMRSRVEAPGLGLPGSPALCLGEEDEWHWVRRKPGQVFCGIHYEEELIGSCPACDFEFSRVDTRARACQGCGLPISALQEAMGRPEGDGYRERVKAMRQEARDALAERAIAVVVSDPTPMTRAQRVCQHNGEIGKTTREALRDGSRDARHYDVALGLAALGHASFSRRQFVTAFLEAHPEADETHALPSDYRVGVMRRGRKAPWFLAKCDRGIYEFVGLNGERDDLGAPTPDESEKETD